MNIKEIKYGMKVDEACHDCGSWWNVVKLQGKEKDFADGKTEIYAECIHGCRGGHRELDKVMLAGEENRRGIRRFILGS
jgi:hypothetical protein